MGAQSAGRPVGVRGDFGLYSLGPGKPMSLGGGGVLSVNGNRYGELVADVWKTFPDLVPQDRLWLRRACSVCVGFSSSRLVVDHTDRTKQRG